MEDSCLFVNFFKLKDFISARLFECKWQPHNYVTTFKEQQLLLLFIN